MSGKLVILRVQNDAYRHHPPTFTPPYSQCYFSLAFKRRPADAATSSPGD